MRGDEILPRALAISSGASSTYTFAGKALPSTGTYTILLTPGYNSAGSATITLTAQVLTPSFIPAAGTYAGPQTVTISGPAGASIRYTTDGSTPSQSAGTLYSAPVAVSRTMTLNAIAYETGWTNSTVSSALYTINSCPNPVSFNVPVTFAPAPSNTTYCFAGTAGQIITMDVAFGVYFGTSIQKPDGSPLWSSGGGRDCLGNCTALGVSLPSTGAYTITFVNNWGGTGNATISLTSNTTNPSIAFGTPASVTASGTNTAQAAFNFSGAAGQNVNLSVSFGNWFALYMLKPDGSILWSSGGSQRDCIFAGCSPSVSLPVTGTYTILFVPDDGDSGTATITLTMQLSAPGFAPPAGTYAGPQTVTISGPAGASIRYTTDGSTPSESAGMPYSAPVTVSNSTTLKAIAYETGWADSPVVSANYTINGITISGQVTSGTTPLSGITVNLTGAQTGSALSDSSGDYSFTVAPGGNYVVTPSAAGYNFCPSSASLTNPTVSQAANFASGVPSREYIYLGSRIIATASCGN